MLVTFICTTFSLYPSRRWVSRIVHASSWGLGWFVYRKTSLCQLVLVWLSKGCSNYSRLEKKESVELCQGLAVTGLWRASSFSLSVPRSSRRSCVRVQPTEQAALTAGATGAAEVTLLVTFQSHTWRHWMCILLLIAVACLLWSLVRSFVCV